ncbi:ALA-interacting subunit 3 [Castilleja foliolosa]|uniref:ALA-interacting subunit n=1 Tax=Castilleja foliolosa TaxID=1961234 RepID=A0ABD3C7K6_9LAMI
MNSNTPSVTAGGSGSAGPTGPRKNLKRPQYSRFTQQELSACKPILTPKLVILSFLLIGFIFIPIGVVSLIASRHVVEIINEYETECIPDESKNNKVGFIKSSLNKNCSRILNGYVKSRSDQQLRNIGSESNTDSCKPEDTININNRKASVVPCGLIAWSLFNDTYAFSLNNNQSLTINKRGISWKSDRDRKFGKHVYPKNFQNGNLIGGGKLDTSKPLSEQEDLIVWMRTAALPTFRKLYGKIEVDLKNGDVIYVSLQNNYNTYSFNGKKKLVLSTSNWLGGKNEFIGIAYITVGGLCIFLAVLFTLIYFINPRQLGDPSYLSWNRNPGGH